MNAATWFLFHFLNSITLSSKLIVLKKKVVNETVLLSWCIVINSVLLVNIIIIEARDCK